MLYFVPTPIGNMGDVSFRTLELFKECESIICEDTRVTKSLINLLNIRYKTQIKPSNFYSLHTHNEKEFFSKINPDFFDKCVLFVSDAGMPGISDPGFSLVNYAIKQNIKYEVLPGANALMVAIVASGFCKKEFSFLGFFSNKGDARQKEIENLLKSPFPCVVYESPLRILKLVSDIALKNPLQELFLIKEISKKFEKKYFGQAKDLALKLACENLKGEWVLISKACEYLANDKSVLCEKDILGLNISLKDKAKLIAKLRGVHAKSVYNELLCVK